MGVHQVYGLGCKSLKGSYIGDCVGVGFRG